MLSSEFLTGSWKRWSWKLGIIGLEVEPRCDLTTLGVQVLRCSGVSSLYPGTLNPNLIPKPEAQETKPKTPHPKPLTARASCDYILLQISKLRSRDCMVNSY